MANSKENVSYTPWAPDLFEESLDFNLESVIKASLDRDFALTVAKPTHLASANKPHKLAPTDLYYSIPNVYKENINLLKTARSIHVQNSYIQSKLSSDPSYKPSELQQSTASQFIPTHSLDRNNFTQTFPKLDERSIYQIARKSVSLSLLNAGFTHSKSSALDKLVDSLNTFLHKLCIILKSNSQPNPDNNFLEDFVDPLEQTLIELGSDGYEGLFEFWQEHMVNYHQKLAIAGTKLIQVQEGLVHRVIGSTEHTETIPENVVEMSSSMIEVAAHGSVLEDSQDSNESPYSDEKPSKHVKRIKLC
ncbi:hypothetical protein LOD99_2503 [Oopsacas minuta]|uniref:STAGA complex 65 subunit gamma n=1 Tax=Oopsacas minuta TaxID=111878 RepID=A0AAV7K2D9_9METZ|nr:hypothetical protein LOD99_2503 [Oopsacas minuta]